MAARNLFERITRQGDRLDLIAWEGWEDPYRVEQVVRANLRHFSDAGVPMVLPANVVLHLPILTREELLPAPRASSDFMPW